MAELASAFAPVVARAGLPTASCSLVWGDVPNPPAKAVRAALDVDGESVVRGWIVCGATQDDFANVNPRTHQIAIVRWNAGEMRASHPSGPGSSPVVLGSGDEGDLTTFVMLSVDPRDQGATMSQLAPALSGLPREFLYVWMQVTPPSAEAP